ncbi:MAG: endolytic transglycosylase MltG [Deltaproteobacteria bacterium]|nr:endolytic transglycosylase MltG [Deltaproteobacteria bacterium]
MSEFIKKKEAPKKIKTGPSLTGRLVGLIGLAAVVALIFGFHYVLEYSNKFSPPDTQSREVLVTIPQGASYPEIAHILKENGLIKDEGAFLLAIRLKSKLKQPVGIKAGEQALDPSLNTWETIKTLVKGNFKFYPFTIPEGRNLREIATTVQNAGLGSAKDFLALCYDKTFIQSLGIQADSLEGYLFPETYNFPKNTPLSTIIKAMTTQFFKVWNKYNTLAAAKGLSQNEVLTMASIVEKETGAAQERPLIAAVFFNRLDKKMRLQTDPTVIYGLPNFNGNLTRADLETPHPYNTYVIQGLPPGPIASPGEDSIKAVLNPANTKYLYFVSKNDGTHHFSNTLAEHNKMVAQYQKSGNKS